MTMMRRFSVMVKLVILVVLVEVVVKSKLIQLIKLTSKYQPQNNPDYNNDRGFYFSKI